LIRAPILHVDAPSRLNLAVARPGDRAEVTKMSQGAVLSEAIAPYPFSGRNHLTTPVVRPVVPFGSRGSDRIVFSTPTVMHSPGPWHTNYPDPMQIAIVLFEGLTALDAVGPYEVLSRIPGAETIFVAAEAGPKRTDNGVLALVADRSIDELPLPDVVVVPGGMSGVAVAMADERLIEWLKRVHETSTWTTSVCTGSLILGAAGILNGVRATTHWAAMDRLRALGAEPVSERVVRVGKIMTAAGVSSGIDMGLTLAAEISGPEVAQAIQLGIEYDPQPPFDVGSPAKAPPALVELVRSLSGSAGAAGNSS
jgi:putative intracellular protease/amidase